MILFCIGSQLTQAWQEVLRLSKLQSGQSVTILTGAATHPQTLRAATYAAQAAGAIVIGKTNTPEFGAKNITEPLAWGPARNPWDPSRTTGGSSGGGGTGGGTDPTQLAHGISIALYNTAFGLIVAIPALMFYRHFRAKVEAYTLTLEQAAERMVPHLLKLTGGRR